MTAQSIPIRREAVTAERKRNRARRWRLLGIVCLTAGFLLPALGLFLMVLYSIIAGPNALAKIGSGLMIASIPMLMLGSHMLDLSER